MHIYISNLTMIGMLPARRRAIVWTNVGILLIWPLKTNFNEMLIKIHIFSLKKCIWKCCLRKRWPFCLCLNMLNTFILTIVAPIFAESVCARKRHPIPHPKVWGIFCDCVLTAPHCIIFFRTTQRAKDSVTYQYLTKRWVFHCNLTFRILSFPTRLFHILPGWIPPVPLISLHKRASSIRIMNRRRKLTLLKQKYTYFVLFIHLKKKLFSHFILIEISVYQKKTNKHEVCSRVQLIRS